MTNIKRGTDAVEAMNRRESDTPSEPLRAVLKIRHVIEQRGLTQKDLAEMTDIRPNAISMLARGYVERLNLDHIERIATALHITDINELVELMPEGEARQLDYK